MSKSEIEKKIDEIIEFSGVSEFIDMPVKRYSSGMYVRLAFSVAAHLSPEIMLIDEVLAVGDIQFQQKCLSKLDSVTRDSGRTIIIVSHNMGSIRKLCKKTILLEKGKIRFFGDTEEAIRTYLCSAKLVNNDPVVNFKNKEVKLIEGKKVYFSKIMFRDNNYKLTNIFAGNSSIYFDIFIVSNEDVKVTLAVPIKNQMENLMMNLISDDYGQIIYLKKGENRIRIKIKNIQLRDGRYNVSLWAGNKVGHQAHDFKKNCASIVIDNSNRGNMKTISLLIADAEWKIN